MAYKPCNLEIQSEESGIESNSMKYKFKLNDIESAIGRLWWKIKVITIIGTSNCRAQ